MIKLCIFDLDGTLANTLYTIAHYGNTALARCGYKEIPDEEYKNFVGNGADVLLRKMLMYTAGSEENVAEVRKVYDELYEKAPSFLTKVYDGMEYLISVLKECGILLCVNSNKPDDMTKAVVSKIFPKNTFTMVEGQKEGTPKKPDPAAVLNILETLNISKNECVYIGDSEVDIKTAKNAGVTSIAVTWGFRDKEAIIAEGPDYIAQYPYEILDFIEYL